MAVDVSGQHRLIRNTLSRCRCHAGLRQPSAVLLLWLVLIAMYRTTAGVCNTVAYNACPSASDAAAALTGSNSQLPITNAAFSGVCNPATTIGYLLMTDMGCHELAPTMRSGALVLSNGDARFGTLITNSANDKGAEQGTIGADTDMQAASFAAGYNQSLLDQVLLTFDITPTVSGNLAFQYVFGSEEYPEFAPSEGNPTSNNNDIFGFFMWSGSSTHVNVGLLPNTTLPVSIGTVNAINNTQYFVPNTLGTASPKATEFDGFTTLLKTNDHYVTAGTTYRIKLGIADGGDGTYDSVVWVRAGSVRFNIKDCVGGFVPNGPCSGACGGGNGILPEVYNITVPAQNGGNPCPIANETTRSNTTCVNNNPCPINCTASWVAVFSSCTGVCGGGSGFTTEVWNVTSSAMYGGSCAHINGTTRATTTPCVNNDPCAPVDCIGSWMADGFCDGACGGGAGLLPEVYNVTVPSAYGGTNCSTEHGTNRNTTACNNTDPCPVDCVGSWEVQNGTCDGECAGGNGTVLERYIITTTTQYGGQPCPTLNNDTRRDMTCTNNDPCPVNCTYYWQETGNCTGACSNGTGTTPEKLVITSPALYGGWCPGTNGSARSPATSCINYTPCPPQDCIGNWGGAYNCNGTCNNGTGTAMQDFHITTPANYGGVPCNYTANEIRYVPCVNGNCCPVNCIGSWVVTGNCTGHCQGGTGVRTETWYVNVSTSCGGTCPFANNTHRNTLTCVNNDTCPPQNCVGSWVANGACNGTCGGGAGILPEIYKVTVPAMYNGTECPVTNWTTRADTPCNNTYPCPINCVGNWVTITGNCTGACQGGQGFVPERYNVTVPAQYGGVDCNYTNGAYRYVIPCTNNNPCPPQDCQGIWVQNGSCMGGCGGQRSRGLLPERYKITVPAAYGGNSCPIAEGDTRMITACTNNNPCVNIPCNATWLTTGACNATCGGASGHLPQRYLIYAPAQDNGTPCEAANNTLRQTVACTNNTPCPVNCVGGWQANGTCNGTCNNGSGLLPEVYVVTTQAQYGGSNCSYSNGITRMTTSCINNTPCPIDCVGAWHPNGSCNGSCGGGSGLLPERYVVTTPAQYGGRICNYTNGATRKTTTCNNTQPCPINCTGQWQSNGTCSGACNNGTGVLPEKYVITQPAVYGGAVCSSNNGVQRNITACFDPTPCPINCTGVFQQNGPCSGACNGGQGTLPEMWVVTVQAQYGGTNCTFTNGTQRGTTPCVTTRSCQPVDCVGSWAAYGPCSALCGGHTGFIPERFVVTTAAVDGGNICTATNGTTRYSTQCVNNTVCPYANVQIAQSPPVLPPLNMSSLNNTDIVIRGGNVSVTGVKVEGLGASATSGNSSFTTDKIEAASTASANVKPRIAAFNGSLGFYTLGVLIDVLGEFDLQRTMNWTWDTTWNAYITEVVIKGRFLLTREEMVNNITVGIQHMDPQVSGYLQLYSAFYPGPGFSGTYDWAGKLEMRPDPFQEWDDAASFLLHNTTTSSSTSSSGRKMLRDLPRIGLVQAPRRGWAVMTATTVPSNDTISSHSKRTRAHLPGILNKPPREGVVAGASASCSGSLNTGCIRSRVLLQTSTGQVPVQGRVAVREAMEATSGVGSNTAYLDEAGDVMVIGPGPGPGSNPNYVPPPIRSPDYPNDIVKAGRSNSKLVMIVLASVLAPAGLAACVSGLVAAGFFRRKKNRDQQQVKEDFVSKRARLHKHREGEHAGRQQQGPSKMLSWSMGRNLDSLTGEQPPTLTEANLDLSETGARRRPVHLLDEDSADRLRSGGTSTTVQHLAPGETGFGSLPGGQEAMVTLPPRSDSADWTSLAVVDRSRPSYASGWRASVNGMRSSLTGIANGFAQALRLRTSNTGGAYGVSHSAAFDSGIEPSGGSTLLWSNPAQQRAGQSRRAGEHRMPTLPGSSSQPTYIAKQRSLNMAEVVTSPPRSPRGPSRLSPELLTYPRRRSSKDGRLVPGDSEGAVSKVAAHGRKPVTRSTSKARVH